MEQKKMKTYFILLSAWLFPSLQKEEHENFAPHISI